MPRAVGFAAFGRAPGTTGAPASSGPVTDVLIDIRDGLRATALASIAILLAVLASLLALAGPARAGEVPEGFEEQTVFSGLTQPTAIRFSPDGRVFVAEKRGLIKVFSDLDDPTPTIFADLGARVHSFWDRGLLGLALDPAFPVEPYVYVLYAHDFDPAVPGDFPRWGSEVATEDGCPTPPGAVVDGCVVSGRLSRLEALGDTMVGDEQPLIEADWCQQYPSHSVGALGFGADGALYASAGDGASFNFADYGQDGAPVNPCDDPPAGRGGTQSPPTAEGGALRSQDLRTAGDPTTLDGSIIRVDPETGDPLPDNPGSGDLNAQRIVAHGFRNPFRFTVRPGTNELWIGDVGWVLWEEINVLVDPGGAPVENFGWPCYEGTPRQNDYDNLNLDLCEDLYDEGGVSSPHFAYHHNAQVVPGESCPTGGSAIAGLAFYQGGPYPPEYDGALFFADHNRRCIWAMLAGQDGEPDPEQILTFVADAANPVDLQIGPGGDLFYVDHEGGTVRRVSHPTDNQPPVAAASASVTSGPAPLEVDFDGTESSDPDEGDSLDFAWDLDGDGQFDDSTDPQPSFTYDAGTYEARLRVTDGDAASDVTEPITITAANTAPVATIDAPAAGTTWTVGEAVAFSGHAVDAQDGELEPSALSWSVELLHCADGCHSHPVPISPDVGGGSFEAPDHGYPSHLELSLTATDSGGLADTATLRLDPETVELTLEAVPLAGVPLTLNGATEPSPVTREAIVGSLNAISAPAAVAGRRSHRFGSWSDGGARSHDVVAPPASTTYTARYRPLPGACRSGAPNVIVGTPAGERLAGTEGDDAIFGLGGDDVAVGLSGRDCLIGGAGVDRLRGKGGRDLLLGGPGADRLAGGAGADLLKGGPGNDVLRGGPGRDVIRCGPGRDLVIVQGRDRVARDCERVRRL